MNSTFTTADRRHAGPLCLSYFCFLMVLPEGGINMLMCLWLVFYLYFFVVMLGHNLERFGFLLLQTFLFFGLTQLLNTSIPESLTTRNVFLTTFFFGTTVVTEGLVALLVLGIKVFSFFRQ